MAFDMESKDKGMSGIGMFFIGLLTGVVIGGITTVLLSPKSGQETRTLIRDKAKETQHMIQSRANDLKEKVSGIGGAMRSRAEKEAQSVESTK